MRIGIGFDAHRFAEGRQLVLGGVIIPFEKGLEGYSDADVLIHAICDALLGALALGDIGTHFPEGEPRYRDVRSTEFLSEVREKVERCGYRVVNVDSTLIAEEPKLSGHVGEMRRLVARTLGCPLEAVSVKATTTEGMGFCGRGEGIAAVALACLDSAEK